MINLKPASRLEGVEEYYFSSKFKQIQELNDKNSYNIINIAIGNPDIPPHQSVISKVIENIKLDASHMYQSYLGIAELRQKMAFWYKSKYGVDIDHNEQILPLMGSKEGIFLISMAFLNQGDAVLVPNPGYITYSSASKLAGAKVIYYDLEFDKNWYPDMSKLNSLDCSNIKIMWINYPNMPTGAKSYEYQLKKIIDFTYNNDILLVNDNPYSFILNDNPFSILSLDTTMQAVMELNSLSKSYNMAGWRIGMLMGNNNHIDSVIKVKTNMDSGMFLPLQYGAIQALSLDDYWFDGLNREYKKRREVVFKILDILNCQYNRDQCGLFVWAKLPKGEDSISWTDRILKNNGVFITPGDIFGSNGKGYIRISLCNTVKTFEEVKNRIKE